MRKNFTNLSKDIKPLFPSKLSVYSQRTFQTIQKRSYKACKKFVIRRSLSDTFDEKGRKLHLGVEMIKLLKPLKHVRRLDLKNFFLKGWEQNFPKMLYLAKKFSYTSSLELSDFRKHGSHQKGLFTCWPKYIKRLEKLSYSVEEPRSVGSSFYDDFNLRQTIALPFKKAESITKFTKGQKNLKTLILQFPQFLNSDQDDFIDYWDFEKYPRSIQELNIELPGSRHSASPSSLEKLENLRNLKLSIGYMYSKDFYLPFLDLVPDVPQLQTFSMNGLDFTTLSPKMVCELPEYLPNLTAFKLGETSLREPGHDDNFPLDSCSLSGVKHLDLFVFICSVAKFFSVMDLISEMEGLITLRLVLHFNVLPQDKKLIEHLFEVISGCSDLKYLSITASISSGFDLDEPIKLSLMPLTKLLTKPDPLKEISISLGDFETSDQCISSFIESIPENGSRLTSVGLSVGKYNIANHESEKAEKVLKFLKSLENIQYLDLQSLNISSLVFFSKVLEIILSMKYLKNLTIGAIHETIAMDSSVTETMCKLLIEKGLKNINCFVPKKIKFEFPEHFNKISEKKVKVKGLDNMGAKYRGLKEFRIFICKYKQSTW